jgi:hypothetical protein
MSTPVVVIGFILLIPSILGILFSLLLLLGVSGSGATVNLQAKRQAASQMQDAGVPTRIINAVLAGNSDYVDQWMNADTVANGRVTAFQEETVRQAQTELHASTVGTGIGMFFGAGLAIFLAVSSFVGGLLGWLLVMRKRVLQCSLCNAVVNAS